MLPRFHRVFRSFLKKRTRVVQVTEELVIGATDLARKLEVHAFEAYMVGEVATRASHVVDRADIVKELSRGRIASE